MKMYDVLEILEWAGQNFGSLHTNKHLTRRDVMRAVRRGLAESAGFGPPCDGDGFVIHGRVEREGFVLTESGRVELAAFREREQERFDRLPAEQPAEGGTS